MINAETGEFKLQDYNLIIHPDLRLSEFKCGDIPVTESTVSKSGISTQCYFEGTMDDLRGCFGLFFVRESLYKMFIERSEQRDFQKRMDQAVKSAGTKSIEEWNVELNDWDARLLTLQQHCKLLNDQWLIDVIGKQPPYIFDWGQIVSCQDERINDDAMIYVEFRSSFVERGYPDIRSALHAKAESQSKFQSVLKDLEYPNAGE